MHAQSIAQWEHSHLFLAPQHGRNERKTWMVVALAGTMMAGEIICGMLFGSIALIADGLHMSTHAVALLAAALAYVFARRCAANPRFAFGTGKFGDLAAFASAIALGMIALLIGYEATERFAHPIPIALREALPIACLGLAANLVSAWLLHDHDHSRHDCPDEALAIRSTGKHHRDLNLRAAYIHVLADAATSLLTIFGLAAAWSFGWLWMDPLAGIAGAIVIANWSFGLVREAGAVLLDATPDPALSGRIRDTLEAGGDRISDLHLWRLGPGRWAAIVSIVTHNPKPPGEYKRRLALMQTLAHVTVEVEVCS